LYRTAAPGNLRFVGDRDQPSRRVVDQRIRNRIIECLELAASYDDQLAYETSVPFVNVPYEVINGWEDWVPPPPRTLVNDLSVFSTAELQAIDDFRPAWDAAGDAIGDDHPSVRDVQAMPEWSELRQRAEAALTVFRDRGKLPEDREVWP
jgi:hypothetical protein